MTPTLIVTRPAQKGAVFADEMRARFGNSVRVILSPLLKIVPVPVVDDLTNLSGVIFTSAQAVDVACLPAGLPAWCVGPQTAARARESGFAVTVGPGDARGLVELITHGAPRGRLAHIRGLHTHENIAQLLIDAGVTCADVIAYDQRALAPNAEAKNALKAKIPVVLPLFSARTATILEDEGPFHADLHLVVMSEQVKQAAARINAQTISMAAEPNGMAMVDATVMRLNALLNRNTNG